MPQEFAFLLDGVRQVQDNIEEDEYQFIWENLTRWKDRSFKRSWRDRRRLED